MIYHKVLMIFHKCLLLNLMMKNKDLGLLITTQGRFPQRPLLFEVVPRKIFTLLRKVFVVLGEVPSEELVDDPQSKLCLRCVMSDVVLTKELQHLM